MPSDGPVTSNETREPWLAILDTAADTADYVSLGTKGVKLYVGPKAYRVYHAFTGTYGRNATGNLRGMVLNRRLRTVFDVSVKVGDAAKQAAFFVSFVRESWLAAHDIHKSNEPIEAKMQRYALVPASAFSRVLIGTASGLNSLLMTAGETACRGTSHGSAYLFENRIIPSSTCTDYFRELRIGTAAYYKYLHEVTSVSAIRNGMEDLEIGAYRVVQTHIGAQ